MAELARDDRGNPITALRPRDIQRSADAEDSARTHLAVHLRQAIKVESQRFSVHRFGLIVVSVVAWAVVQVIVVQAGLGRYPGVRSGAFIGGIIILVIIGREVTRRRVSRLVAATAVAEGICGQCCYSLNSVPTDPDGRITCPECGAAWAYERITRPHWLAASLATTFHDEWLPWRQWLSKSFWRFLTSTPKPSALIAADDRGRFVRTVDSRFFNLPRARREELTIPRVTALRKETRRRGRVLRGLLSVPFAAVSVTCVIAAIKLLDDHEELGCIVVASFGLFFLIVTIAVNFSHSFLPPAHTARVLAADGLCGSCVSPIDSQPADPDGCTTCSACGAAWRIAPQTQP